MGLYGTRCEKCGQEWWFCSVSPMQMIGKPCKCDKKYHKEIN